MNFKILSFIRTDVKKFAKILSSKWLNNNENIAGKTAVARTCALGSDLFFFDLQHNVSVIPAYRDHQSILRLKYSKVRGKR